MNTKVFFTILTLVLFISACTQQEPVKEVKVSIVEAPEQMVSGQPAKFVWKLDPAIETEHTNMHSSFSADMVERTDTPKQPGNKQGYSDTLVLESDVEQTVYVQAHAHIDGKDLKSEMVQIKIVPAKEEPIVAQEEVKAGEPEEVQEVKEPKPEVKEFMVKAFQFGFDPDTLVVNKGDTVRLSAYTMDVPHGLKIMGYDVNMVLNSQEPVTVEFVANTPGEFPFFCSIPCGSGHGAMQGKLVVNP